ncbi:uncharacterized protein A4U43_C03F30190 [Asparagus officinalis]|uniref:DYW domain-containing protein n=1 Tax=Asparagus officinalis TaxID=4686 RepID=A0A5P1FE29_ASPOF|nr:putative pentatricopeptide repeat-containing protein At3g49142 [Asparagus officinalis]ONK76616.1 uncharacterized protein A4U43_C03F30190 [Asparagus officinalis]
MRKAIIVSFRRQITRTLTSSSPAPYETLLESLTPTPASIPHLLQIHALIITNGFSSKSVLACRLITSYASLRSPKHARILFDLLPKRATHTYNHLLKALMDIKQYQSVFWFYSSLLSDEWVSPDYVTFSIVIKACVALKLERVGKVVHAHVLVCGSESDLRLDTDLLQFYLKCGCLDYAHNMFDLMPKRDDFAWAAMIDGLVRSGAYADALKIFCGMRDSGLKAGVVTWNVLISGLARNGLYNEALHYMKLMQWDGVKLGYVILSSILASFAQRAVLKPGLEAHAYVIRNGLELDLFVISSLVDMYAKCGKLSLARCLFDRSKDRDTGLWNAMIVGYGMNGDCKESLSLLAKMIDSGVQPSDITFTAVISACSHRGMVSEGLGVFNLMVDDYKILITYEHYACMVDMFGRAGLLKGAYEFIMSMPIEPSKDIWGAFISACRIHSDAKFMEIAARQMNECSDTSETTGYHVMMSNMYAESGQWREMAGLRTKIKNGRMKKRTGCSWIEIGDSVHVFSIGDFSHPQHSEIYFMLRNLNDDISGVSMSKFEEFFYNQVEI